MFKEFLLKQMMKRQLKGLPESEVDRIVDLVGKNPEVFQKIGDEIKAKIKSGRSEQAATMEVMRMHQAELQKILQK
jgi:cell division septum initiation protein DivIVA